MKGIVFSYFFPPLNSSEGNVTFKLINASKYDYEVFYQNQSDLWSYGKNIFLRSDRIKVIPSNTSDLEGFRDKGIALFSNDKMAEYGFMMSRSMPLESHQIALAIKKRNSNKFWLASFGDPIANNPYEKFAYEYTCRPSIRSLRGIKLNIKHQLMKTAYKKKNQGHIMLQNEIFSLAEKLIFNSEHQCRYMLGERYDELIHKALILPHPYDLNLYKSRYEEIVGIPENSNFQDSRIKILFAGHTDDIRSLRYFLQALESQKEYFKDKLQFTILGNLPQSERDYISLHDLSSLIVYGKQVSYEKSLLEMRDADLLVHVDAEFPPEVLQENIFFAAKISDYLGSGTKIVGLTSGGISKNILTETGQYCLTNNKVIIANFLYDVTTGKVDLSKNPNPPAKYNSVNIAKIYDDVLDKEIKGES
ncbi:hypothetical protein AZF37_01090 [endosymbiont 'TC1' of Trimyema compressum]|uniref:glycosyltransferase family 1 protein n=1 Tax=endosymbiont 'TC1' of Trimyema compressum TaxID=243899 RepID=UPI0007F17B97|nr:glycosyltransferase family 1 protein [endosymbiont 'TC1' of Trimyema compressum]AMP19964.1 hypothetical protein AZF37_01090 [endosymbiont 'TC1' of Trimyema compressum]